MACLLIMAGLHGVAADDAKLRHQFGQETFTTQTILLAAQFLGMSAKVVRQDLGRLDRAPLPAIAIDREGRYFIVAKLDVGSPALSSTAPANAETHGLPNTTRVLIQRAKEPPTVLGLDGFLAQWTGEMIFFTSKASFVGETAQFDFTWFIPAVIKYRKLLGEVLLISLVLQIIGLATPLFFQVVMDKVLVNHAMKTLNVIAIGLLCATLFEAALKGIRTYVFSRTSSKIDVELGARLFKHLLNLPMSYFQARRVGDSVARIRELENIIERAVIMAEGGERPIDVCDLFAGGRSPLDPMMRIGRSGNLEQEAPGDGDSPVFAGFLDQLLADRISLESVEEGLMREAVSRSKGNLSRAARLLGVTRPKLAYRLRNGKG